MNVKHVQNVITILLLACAFNRHVIRYAFVLLQFRHVSAVPIKRTRWAGFPAGTRLFLPLPCEQPIRYQAHRAATVPNCKSVAHVCYLCTSLIMSDICTSVPFFYSCQRVFHFIDAPRARSRHTSGAR